MEDENRKFKRNLLKLIALIGLMIFAGIVLSIFIDNYEKEVYAEKIRETGTIKDIIKIQFDGPDKASLVVQEGRELKIIPDYKLPTVGHIFKTKNNEEQWARTYYIGEPGKLKNLMDIFVSPENIIGINQEFSK